MTASPSASSAVVSKAAARKNIRVESVASTSALRPKSAASAPSSAAASLSSLAHNDFFQEDET